MSDDAPMLGYIFMSSGYLFVIFCVTLATYVTEVIPNLNNITNEINYSNMLFWISDLSIFFIYYFGISAVIFITTALFSYCEPDSIFVIYWILMIPSVPAMIYFMSTSIWMDKDVARYCLEDGHNITTCQLYDRWFHPIYINVNVYAWVYIIVIIITVFVGIIAVFLFCRECFEKRKNALKKEEPIEIT